MRFSGPFKELPLSGEFSVLYLTAPLEFSATYQHCTLVQNT